MSFLTLIQSVALKVGVSQPTTVVGNANLEVQELVAFANEEGRELVRRGDWHILTKEKTHTTLPQESQTGMLPDDYDHIIDETLWNRTKKRRLFGPVSSQQWQQIKSWDSSPVTDTIYLRGGAFLMNPVPPAGDTLAFEYISRHYCASALGAGQSVWTADTDVGVLPESLMELGTIVRFKAAKGLDFAVDLAKYDTQVLLALGMDKPNVTLDMKGGGGSRMAGVVVPDGSWTI